VNLNTLKDKLTVTVTNNDGSTGELGESDYELSATTAITNATTTQSVTVTYGAFTTTFDVAFSEDIVTHIEINFVGGAQPKVAKDTTLDQIKAMLIVIATRSDNTTFIVDLSGYDIEDLALAQGQNTITIQYGGINKDITIEVTGDSDTILFILIAVAGLVLILIILVISVVKSKKKKAERRAK